MDLQKVTLPLLILDVEKNDTKQALAHVLNQHDAGYEQPFILNSGDDTYDAPAEDFHFRASRPDGQIIDVDNSNSDLVQKGEQNWILNLPNGVTEAPGLVKCVIYVKDGGQVLASSQQIVYNVIPAFDVDNVNHISYVNDLDTLKAKLTDLVGKAQEQINGLSGIITDKNQAADQKLKEELDKITQQAGDWLNGEKTTIDSKIQAVIDKLNADKKTSLQAINDDWAKQKTSLQADIARFKDDLAKQIKSITDSVKALNTNDLPSIQAKVKGFSDALDKLNGQISAIKLDLTGYAKAADVNKAIDTKADKSALTAYALKKDVPSIAGLETTISHKADVDALNKALANKADKTALDSYALKKDVPAAPDLTGYAKKTDLPTVPNLDGYAKTEDVNKELDNKANRTDLSAYETSTDHKSDIDKLNKALDSKANVSAIPALPDMSKYALKTDLKNVDLTGYLTKDDTTRLLGEKANESELANYAKKSDLPPIPNLSIYAKVTDVANALNTKADKADLANYAKKTDTTAIPDTSNFVTKEDLEKSAIASDYYANVPDGAVAHANVYRNKVINLSNADTKAQIKQAIKDETFRNIFPGDIWEINNRRYYVADINAENYGPTNKDVNNVQTYRPTVSLLTMIPKPDGAGEYWSPVISSSNDLSNKGVAGADIQASIKSLTASVKQDFDNNLLYFNSELSDKINSDGTFHIAKSNISMQPEWYYCQLSALPSEIMVTGNSRFALKPDQIDFNVYFVTGKQMAIAKLNANFTKMMLDNETEHGQLPSDWAGLPGGITLQDLSSKTTNLMMNEYGNIGENSISNGGHGAFVYYIIYDL